MKLQGQSRSPELRPLINTLPQEEEVLQLSKQGWVREGFPQTFWALREQEVVGTGSPEASETKGLQMRLRDGDACWLSQRTRGQWLSSILLGTEVIPEAMSAARGLISA